MKRVLFVNGVVYLPGEGGYKRSMYLFNMMRNMGYEVSILTSDFNHYAKQTRDVERFRKEYPDFDGVKIVHMPKYEKNISIKRWFCEKIYSRNAINWIKDHIDNYDVVYLTMPDIDIILGIDGLLKERGIPMIIDVRDLRPEALKVKLRNPFIYNLVTWKMKIDADKCYACADELVAVSKEYLDRALKVNKKSKNPEVVYIGSILELFDEGVRTIAPGIHKPEGEFWLTYAGTIGSSYDLKTAIDAMEIISKKAPNVRLKILGQGPDRPALEAHANSKGLPVDFVGFVKYAEMAAYLSKSDIALNSIKKGASQSIINKVADYYAAGIPMLNSCWCEEQIWLNDHFKVGVNHKPEDVTEFVEKFTLLYNDEALRQEMGANARRLAEERFDRANSYKTLIKVIENVEKR